MRAEGPRGLEAGPSTGQGSFDVSQTAHDCRDVVVALLPALAASPDRHGRASPASSATRRGRRYRAPRSGSSTKTTGVAVEAVSDGQGAYRADALAPGRYRVETALDGFETAVRRIVIEAGQTAAIDVTLNPARLTESVVVTARRVEEAAQEVPIPVSVVSGELDRRTPAPST